MERVDVVVVGAGVVGLAIAAEFAGTGASVVVVEKNASFGEETSSRNSEVIHAGIYYPPGSLKAKLCVAGARLLYAFCRDHNVPHAMLGKLIVASDGKETEELEVLYRNGRENGVDGLRLLSCSEIKALEPQVEAQAAIFSPSTGIVDSHRLMKALAASVIHGGGSIVYRTEFMAAKKTAGGFTVVVKDAREGEFAFESRLLVNAGGLHADTVASRAGCIQDVYTLEYCKGDYFRVCQAKAGLVKHLVYPVPKKHGSGLGIHATPDLGGGLRLGPDDEYVPRIDYAIDGKKRQRFYESVVRYLPSIEPGDLAPDTSGIRPKVRGSREGFTDFIIRDEAPRGLPGLINLIGIESPGLTASLAIAGMARAIVE